MSNLKIIPTFLKLFGHKRKWLLNSQMRNYATRKRFYRNTGVLSSDGKYEITLDQRKLKTPNGKLFIVNSEPLALAVAAEWDSQKTTIQQSSMHLTALCSTFLDNPNNLKKDDIVNYVANFLETDTILFHSNDSEELYNLQIEEWNPVINWFNERYNMKINASRYITGPEVKNHDKDVLCRHLLSYNFPSLIGFMFAVDTLKSIILTLACVDRFLQIDRAVLLTRLEEEFQLGHWGRVEWAHDLNQQELQARLSAAILFIYFNSSTNIIQKKK